VADWAKAVADCAVADSAADWPPEGRPAEAARHGGSRYRLTALQHSPTRLQRPRSATSSSKKSWACAPGRDPGVWHGESRYRLAALQHSPARLQRQQFDTSSSKKILSLRPGPWSSRPLAWVRPCCSGHVVVKKRWNKKESWAG
jgi:hypothetical protein